MVEQRFRRLLAGGFICMAEGEYELTQRGQASLRIFGGLRAFFRHAAAPIP
jgi:hypothetical protein